MFIGTGPPLHQKNVPHGAYVLLRFVCVLLISALIILFCRKPTQMVYCTVFIYIYRNEANVTNILSGRFDAKANEKSVWAPGCSTPVFIDRAENCSFKRSFSRFEPVTSRCSEALECYGRGTTRSLPCSCSPICGNIRCFFYRNWNIYVEQRLL